MILLTGSSGFVGSRLLKIWSNPGQLIPISVRDKDTIERINWNGITSVVHLGGMAHQMPPAPSASYFEINEHLTIQLAKAAKLNGVRQFIFLSTIKVYGDAVEFMNETTECHPTDPYGQSKLNAENGLKELSDFAFVIGTIRSPLVVGEGAKGNLLSLMKRLNKTLPLPLLGIDNRRSMVALDNLIEMIRILIEHPKEGMFLATEKEPISTSVLATSIRNRMEGTRLVKMPFPFPEILRVIIPRTYHRLFGDSVIDNGWTVKSLNFEPVISLEDSINQMVDKFLTEE